MHKIFFILIIHLVSEMTHGQYVYHGQIRSVIRQQPITYGVVRLPRPQGTGRYGRQLAKIDSLGYFSFSLKDTSNVQIVVDCALSGKTMQRIFYTDSVMTVWLMADCYDYNAERAENDIKKNEPSLLCQLGYASYKFSGADSAFEKKYGITYHSFADEPIWSDCMWLYNRTIVEYLDKKFGREWRKEVRWDVPFP